MCYDLNYLWTTTSAQRGAVTVEGAGGETAPRASVRGLGVWALSPKMDFSTFFSEDEAYSPSCPMWTFCSSPA